MNRKHDYDLLEREYIAGDMSLRELARGHGMSHSLIMAQSQRNKWPEKREEFRRRATSSAVAFMADREAWRRVREAEVRDDAIELISEAINKTRGDMRATQMVLRGDEMVEEPVYRMRPADVVALIDRLQVLFGKPSHITEERHLGVSIDSTASPELLRGIIDATRGLDSGSSQRSPLPGPDKPREN